MAERKPDRSAIIFLIAFFKLVKAVALVAIGIGAFKFMNKNLNETLGGWANSLRIDPDNHYLKSLLSHTLNISKKKMEFVGIATFIYAALFGTEGVALFLGKRWAEYLVIISTSLLMPLEIYEICVHANAIKIATLVINAFAVVYLVVRVRKTASQEESVPKPSPPPSTA